MTIYRFRESFEEDIEGVKTSFYHPGKGREAPRPDGGGSQGPCRSPPGQFLQLCSQCGVEHAALGFLDGADERRAYHHSMDMRRDEFHLLLCGNAEAGEYILPADF